MAERTKEEIVAGLVRDYEADYISYAIACENAHRSNLLKYRAEVTLNKAFGAIGKAIYDGGEAIPESTIRETEEKIADIRKISEALTRMRIAMVDYHHADSKEKYERLKSISDELRHEYTDIQAEIAAKSTGSE